MANIPVARDNSTLFGNVVLASRFVQTPLIQGPAGGTQPVTIGTTQFGGTSSVIGTVDLPSSLCVGEGGKYTEGMVVQSNTNDTNGVWLDLTSVAIGPTNPVLSPQQFAILQGNTANNALFVGADQPFFGICYIPNIAFPGLSNDSVWQFWNGASWQTFNVMAAQSVQPLDQFANTPFERSSGTQENLHFMNSMTNTWQTLTLNGFNKYWIKVILTGAIGTIPEITTLKLIPSYKLIDVDGHQEYYGFAKKCHEIVFHRKLLETINSQVPPSDDINFTATMVINAVNNELANGATDAIGGTLRIPCSTCTSDAVQIFISWFPLTNNAGDVELEIEATQARVGDNINNNSLASTIFSQITNVPANNSGVMFQTVFNIPINTLVPTELLAVRIFRDASGGNPDDTLTGNIALADVTGEVKSWK